MKRTILPAILAVAFAFSCEYANEKQYFKDVPPADLRDVTIELPGNENDTLFIYKSSTVSYRALVGDRQMLSFQVLLNDTDLSSGMVGNGSFPIYVYQFPTGYYTLRLRMTFQTGSGSLADKIGMETSTLEKKWVVYIDTSPPTAVNFVSVGPSNGMLEVHWNKYPFRNFDFYQLTKYCYDDVNNYYQPCWSKTIADRETTSLRDSTFIGGKVKYAIQVNMEYQSSPVSEAAYEWVYTPSPKTKWINKTQVKVSWQKPPLPLENAFFSYTLLGEDFGTPITRTDINDTTYIFTPPVAFGSEAYITVATHPYGEGSYGYRSGTSYVFIGDRFPLFQYNSVVYNAALDRYLAVVTDEFPFYGNRLVTINPATYAVEKSLHLGYNVLNFTISDNGQYLYVYFEQNVLKRIDPATLTEQQSYSLYSLDNRDLYSVGRLSVSNNNRLTVTDYALNAVIDMDTFTAIQKKAMNRDLLISPSGNFLLEGGAIWKWDGAQYVQVATVVGGVLDAVFKGDDKLIAFYRGTARITDLSTLTLDRSILLEIIYPRYDPKSNLIGGFTDVTPDKNFMLYSLNQNEPVATFPVANVSTYYGNTIVLVNNKLISSTGFIQSLSYFYP
jgi:hypothetical protein